MSTETNSLYSKIESILKSIPELITEEKELRYNKIKEMAENGDATLLIPLMKDKKIKDAFFAPILDSFVFKTKEFKEFLDYSSSNNSYSQYLGKRIGLYTGDSSLLDRTEVVLNFPFKDCVLEGGQKKEDGLDTYFEYDEKAKDYVEKTDKRKEVFFNEILAKDEIDSLFSPKAFCNVKKFTEKGAKACTSFERDAELNRKRGLSEDTITDNLIVKGNNLLALHSLKEEFEGKVKLIYIDPPYNTGSDDFKYNDNFNHSSWLTFMKNRLEVARDLLREDGCIFVSLDDKEDHYCKIILDEIFGRENFIADICHKSRGSISNDKIISPNHNHVLFYGKNERAIFENRNEYGIEKDLSTFKEKDENGYYKLVPVDGPGGEKKGNPYYTFLGITKYWRFSKKRMQEMYDQGLIVKKGNSLQQKYYKSKASESRQTITTWWDEGYLTSSATTELNDLLGDGAFNNPKNESLLELIISFASRDADIVLDYHLGSGTTAAVAHKMDRQYIGVEQMDYIQTISCERLKKVIGGEQGGISKSVN